VSTSNQILEIFSIDSFLSFSKCPINSSIYHINVSKQQRLVSHIEDRYHDAHKSRDYLEAIHSSYLMQLWSLKSPWVRLAVSITCKKYIMHYLTYVARYRIYLYIYYIYTCQSTLIRFEQLGNRILAPLITTINLTANSRDVSSPRNIIRPKIFPHCMLKNERSKISSFLNISLRDLADIT
jgi:hypothetical protein